LKDSFESKINSICENIIAEYKELLSDDMFNLVENSSKFKIVKYRIRGNKVQKRVKVSTRKGYSIKGGRLVQLSAQEMIRRKMGARHARIKRRIHIMQSLKKRKFALRKRTALGL
jgi:hypothetical protein